eukprot:CAMPEP_0117420040 /NCGR_PEP_ID=MMETSP0758-20121206/1468_1 /TAXON_ID=63605 /ORGANISM="Percolomonas cosmopolitus, Strain AE-1 (ATCC 50343)" /LENGTH=233 /DNA_ID=CAMNT_0005201439 /DNA_START=277 /DNA_END=976 /DNA_ORIENTATION=+
MGDKRNGIGDSSVEEEIQLPIKDYFNAASVKFMSSGREDADVRMLGTGRPFSIKISKPTANVLDVSLNTLQEYINNQREQPYVTVNSLQYDQQSAERTHQMNKDAVSKRKRYRCVVHVTGNLLTRKLIDYIHQNATHGIPLTQWTPIRVLHRRPNIARTKHIYDLSLDYINASFAILELETSSGTYIKEFVSGDFGRTMPSFVDLCITASKELNLDTSEQLCTAQADILQLDV